MSEKHQFTTFIASKLGLSSRRALTTIGYKLGVISIVVGIASSIICCLVMVGFHKSIERRIVGLLGDVIISPLYCEGDFDTFHASNLKNRLEARLGRDLAQVKCVTQRYVLLQNAECIEGVALSGVHIDRDMDLKKYLVRGSMPAVRKNGGRKEILLSQNLVTKLDVKLGSDLLLCSTENLYARESFEVVGIYNTHLPDFDEKFAFCDAGVLEEIFGLENEMATSVNCFLKKSKTSVKLEQAIEELAGPTFYTRSMKKEYSDIFEWIDVLYRNTVIFLIILLIVVNTNIASIATVQLIERHYMINALSILGATHWQLMRIFLSQNVSIIGKGLLYGNAVGIAMCALQHFLKLIKLDSDIHYIEYVPIEWNWGIILWINGFAFGIIFLSLVASYFFVLKRKFHKFTHHLTNITLSTIKNYRQ